MWSDKPTTRKNDDSEQKHRSHEHAIKCSVSEPNTKTKTTEEQPWTNMDDTDNGATYPNQGCQKV